MQNQEYQELIDQDVSVDVLKEKYLKAGENTKYDLFRRVAKGLASVEKTEEQKAHWEEVFYNNMLKGGIGAGRIMSVAGTTINATAINCFVQPVGDCIQGVDDEGFPGIYEALRESAETMRRGGGVGYDFSRIRPKGAEVKGTHSIASGPCSYINVFDQSCSTVESAGARRGAQMGVLRIDHPDVLEFITAKRTPGRWNNFNVSVGVSDEFMQAVLDDKDWELVHKTRPGKSVLDEGGYQRDDGKWVYRKVPARQLWDTIMQSAYDFAEPGILFLDQIGRDNNLNYCETIAATNPCVTADSWAHTTNGPTQVKDLIGKSFVSVLNGLGHKSAEEGFFSSGIKEVFRVTAKEGYFLRLTANHPLQRIYNKTEEKEVNEWVETSNLQPGDRVMMNNHTHGCMWEGKGSVEDGQVAAKNYEVGEMVETTSSNFHLGYLQAIFQDKGDLNTQGDQNVTLKAFGDASLQMVQRMLVRFGILSAIDASANTLSIKGVNLDTFSDKLGFEINALQTEDKLLDYSVEVESIVSEGEEEVYDVQIPGINAFDCNGFVTHNCGEQPLPSYGCCDLGPIILTHFVHNPFGVDGKPEFDFEALEHSVAVQVRALDNVLDLTWWPLPQQHAESQSKRRIGVGFTGLGNTLSMLCLRYDRDEGRQMAAQISERMRNAAYRASVELAKEKGAFPKFDAKAYLGNGTFASRLPADIKAEIKKYGIRNSHLLSIAPTGTVSLAFADNASNGIEPAFSWEYNRKKRNGDGTHTFYRVQDHAYRLYEQMFGLTEHKDLPEYFVNALEMSVDDHIGMMETVQPFIDTSISKTTNVPADYPFEDFKGLYMNAWKAGLKGMATYRPNDTLGSVLSVDTPKKEEPKKEETKKEVDAVDPFKVMIEKRPKGVLQAVSSKIEYSTHEGLKRLYLIVSFMPIDDGQGGKVERAIEFFMPVGQNTESQQWITATMRTLSLAARSGFLMKALSDMRKVVWDRGPVRLGMMTKEDGTQRPMFHDSEVAAIAYAIETILKERRESQATVLAPAPVSEEMNETIEATFNPGVMSGKKCNECGAHAVIKKDGCEYCTSCGAIGSCG